MEEKLHHRLKKKMKEKGLSQRQLALMCSLTEASVSKYLSGVRTPHIEVIGKLAKALDTTSDYLLGIDENNGHYAAIKKVVDENKSYLSMEERMSLIMSLSEK